jgi:hypothetical protein
MRSAAFAGLLLAAGAHSTSRVGCGLAAARKDLAAEKTRSHADGEHIEKLEERIRRLEAVCGPADAGRPEESAELRAAGK